MHTGHYISGAGHLGLIGWLLLGNIFTSEPDPVEMTEVSVISAAEYDALVSAQQPPASTTEVAQPALPAPSEEAPEVTAEPDAEIEQPEPVQTETPPEDTPPEVTELELPPQTEVDDSAPELNEPIGDTAVLVPEIAPEARPRDEAGGPGGRLASLAAEQPIGHLVVVGEAREGGGVEGPAVLLDEPEAPVAVVGLGVDGGDVAVDDAHPLGEVALHGLGRSLLSVGRRERRQGDGERQHGAV